MPGYLKPHLRQGKGGVLVDTPTALRQNFLMPDALTAQNNTITAYVGLGSNLEDSAAQLQRAVSAIGQIEGIRVTALSPVYRSEPQLVRDQPWFCNQSIQLACACHITPYALLECFQAIEKKLGRKPAQGGLRYGPRHIDIDLLLFGQVKVADARLVLPHPRMHERAFVLVPLRDIDPDILLPGGLNVSRALEMLPYRVCGRDIFQ
jgi:2-amino-4-hydroxy-6-hydroxymethyldihydropteridine diphosphokinase